MKLEIDTERKRLIYVQDDGTIHVIVPQFPDQTPANFDGLVSQVVAPLNTYFGVPQE